MKIAPGQWLTSSEVAVLLQVNPSTVKKWVDDGLIAAFRTPGRHRRIRPQDLVEFLRKFQMPIPRELDAASRKRMLIVDDDPSHLRALTRAFGRHKDFLDVVSSSSGIDALVLVGSSHPNLVLLDLVMPDIDGVEVCRRLKANPATADIDVVLMSGHLSANAKRKALEAGALRCLNKPIDVNEVLSILRDGASHAVDAGA